MRTKTIEWQVAGACNYDCTYCIQSKAYRRGRPQRAQLETAIDTFSALPGRWEIKCSGGEAFAHPLFMQLVVPELVARTPHAISVLTNFSASRAELMEFARLTRGRLAVFSASLHLEFTTVEEFADKIAWFSLMLDPDVKLVVNQVVLPGREADATRGRDAIEARGVRWFAQLYKHDGGVAAYPEETLVQLIGTRPANRAPSYRGRTCWAGVDYFTVDKDGDAWSCRTAKRGGEGKLGNLFDGTLRRRIAPLACSYDICPCTVPANRGMIEGIAAAEDVE
jgi:sulfatase maturation enzyme AslB (radical SAM superfamily)